MTFFTLSGKKARLLSLIGEKSQKPKKLKMPLTSTITVMSFCIDNQFLIQFLSLSCKNLSA